MPSSSDSELRTKAAAHVFDARQSLRFRQSQLFCGVGRNGERALRRCVDRGRVAAAIIDDHAVRFETRVMDARVRCIQPSTISSAVAKAASAFCGSPFLFFLLNVVFFGDYFRSVRFNRRIRMDHVRQHFVGHFDCAQCVARDLRCRCCDCRNGRAGETNLGQRRRDDRLHAGNLRRGFGVEFCDARVSVRATKNATRKACRAGAGRTCSARRR